MGLGRVGESCKAEGGAGSEDAEMEGVVRDGPGEEAGTGTLGVQDLDKDAVPYPEGDGKP